MKPLKIAICFSGQMRTWRNSISNIREFLRLDEGFHEIDLFAHTWNYNTWIDLKYENIFNGPKYQNSFEEEISQSEIDDFISTYNFTNSVVDKKISVTNSWDHMLYSFMSSINIKRQHEIKHSFEYDLVVKIRPDTIWRNIKFEYKKITPLTIVAGLSLHKMPNEYFQNDLNDVLFWGDSMSMDLLANCYRWTIQNTVDNKKFPENQINTLAFLRYGPGTLLHKYANILGLAVFYEQYPWEVVRKR